MLTKMCPSLGLSGICFTAGLLASSALAEDLSGKIYLILPNSDVPRYTQFDAPNIRAAFEELAPAVQLEVLNSEGSAQQMIADFDAALAAGAKGIILIAADPNQAGGALASAARDGVPVVTFAHDPGPGPVNYHVSVPFTDIGENQGKWMVDHLPETDGPIRVAYMLGDPNFQFYPDQMKGFDAHVNPLIEAGKVEIVCRADAMGYIPSNAQRNMEQCLTTTDNDIDAVVIMNDGTGDGVVAALAAQNLEGKVTVFGGYDATLSGVQRVLAGWQSATMSPPFEGMAYAAAELLISAIEGKEAPEDLVNSTWENGFTEGGVPTRREPNVFITADNIQETVIDSGLYTKDELCTGIAVDSAFCTAE
ncbi:MAG: substrate-binding domain-containing protein [Rhodospirillaceae bacterium]